VLPHPGDFQAAGLAAARCDCCPKPDGFPRPQDGLRFPVRQVVPGFPDPGFLDPGFPEELRPGDFQRLLLRGLRRLNYHAARVATVALGREAPLASSLPEAARPVWTCRALAGDDLQPPAVWLQPPRGLSPAPAAGLAPIERVLSHFARQVEYCGPLHELRALKPFASRPREQCCFALAAHLRTCRDSPRSRCYLRAGLHMSHW
jgi:hypothetical protein